MTPVLEAARAAARAHLSILPVAEDGTKRPDVPTWAEYQTRQANPAELKAWRFSTRTGLGIVAGPGSACRECWDFDDAATFDAFVDAATSCGLADVVARVRRGYEDVTPRGGRRWIVGYPPTMPWAKTVLAGVPVPGNPPTVKALIELPMFNIVAPSHGGVHASGRPYSRVSGGFDTIAAYSLDERAALVRLAQTFDQRLPRDDERSRPSPGSDGTRPGDLYNQRAAWADVLAGHFHSPAPRRDGTTAWWRTGKRPPQSLSATTGFAGTDLLFVFSTSTPLPADRGYSKFSAYAQLQHGGDYAAAAKALWAAGYRDEAHADDPPTITLPTSWPAPLPPIAFHGLFGAIVQTMAPETESDPAALLVQLLVLFGNIIGRGPGFIVEDTSHYLNLFAVIVGESSKSRKGTSYARVESLFADLDPRWTRASGLSSGEGLIWHVRDPIEKADGTGDPGVRDKRLLVVEPEFASVLRVLAREGNTLSAVVRAAWDGRQLRTLTKTSPATATGAHVSVIGHITVDEFKRYLTATETANGFGNRFLVVGAKRARLLPLGGQLPDLADARGMLARVLEHARSRTWLDFDVAARGRWVAVYERLSAGRRGLWGAMTARAEAQTRRLAVLYALSDGADLVERPHLEAALAVWTYCSDSAAAVFGTAVGDPLADKILIALQATSDGMTRNDIRELVGHAIKALEIERALALLLKFQVARSVSEPTLGRPTERWFAIVGAALGD